MLNHAAVLLMVLSGLSSLAPASAQGGCTNNLCNVSVSFVNPKAGFAAAVVVEFKYAQTVEEQDQLQLFLPGFVQLAGPSTPATVEAGGAPVFRVADWDQATERLTLTCDSPGVTLSPLVNIKVTIPNGFLKLPVFGIVKDDPQFLTQYRNANGVPVETGFFSLPAIQPVGVIYNVSLAYDPELPNYPTELSLNFTHSAAIAPGDSVSLDLENFILDVDPTNFQAAIKVCTNQFQRSRTCSLGNITGTASVDGTSVKIRLNFADRIEKLEAVQVTIPSSANIRLPQSGLTENADTLQIETDADAGPVALVKIQASERVTRTTLSYNPSKLGIGECNMHDQETGACTGWVDESSDITLSITTGQQIEVNQTVLVNLPAFTRQKLRGSQPGVEASLVSCGSTCDLGLYKVGGISSSLVWGVRWTESSQQLNIDFRQQVLSNTLISITIPASAGLMLPNTTLVADDPQFNFFPPGASAFEIKGSPAVGGFIGHRDGLPYGTTAISIGTTPRVGLPASLTISFALLGQFALSQCIIFCNTLAGSPAPAYVKFDLDGPELVFLTLDGFKRTGGNLEHIATGNPKFSGASWADDRSTLILTASQAIAASEQIDINIPSSAGIMLPSDGLTRNDFSLRIATNAEAAPVQDTAIASVPAIGMFSFARVDYSPIKAGVPVEIYIRLTLNRRIDAAERVPVQLDGYFRPAGLSNSLSATCQIQGVSFLTYPEWAPTTSTISIVAGAGGIPSDQLLFCVFPKTNQIHMREEGMTVVAPKRFWRVVNKGAVTKSWLVSEVSFFSDSDCHDRLIPSNVSSAFASVGTGMARQAACSSQVFANATVGCPMGYRKAIFSEIAGCKEYLCNADLFPDFLIAHGDNASLSGRGYGCTVSTGLTGFSDSELICVPSVASPENAFDNSSASWWWSSSSFTGTADREAWVGVEFDQSVAVQCVTVEQDSFTAEHNAPAVAIQSSSDGMTWTDVLEGMLNAGVSQVSTIALLPATAHQEIKFSTNAVRGPVVSTPFATRVPVGSFTATSTLSFGNPVAGERTSVTFSAIPTMEISPGDQLLELKLTHLSAPSTTALNFTASYYKPITVGGSVTWQLRQSITGSTSDSSVSSSAGTCSSNSSNCTASQSTTLDKDLFSASWSDTDKSILITFLVTAYPGYKIEFTFAESNNFTLPELGIAPSECGTGPTTEPGVSIQPDGTSVPCGTCQNCTGSNENEFTLATNTPTGYIDNTVKTVIRNIQRIGLFRDTSLDYSLLSAAYDVNITVNFTLNREFLAGDQVTLHLPSFHGSGREGVLAEGPSSMYFAGLSWNQSASELTITANASVMAQTKVSLMIPAKLGVRLSPDGTEANDPTLRISTNAKNGLVAPVSIAKSPVFGSFTGDLTRLAYTPAEFRTDGTPYIEGRIAAIAVGFALSKKILVGETVFVNLHGFSRASGDAAVSVTDNNVTSLSTNFTTVDTNGVFSAFTTGSWDESSTTLTLTASKEVPAFQRHVVLVKSTAGIKLPSIGLEANDPRLTIGTNAINGPNTGTPIDRSPKLHEVCGAECAVWEFECSATCRCGQCAP